MHQPIEVEDDRIKVANLYLYLVNAYVKGTCVIPSDGLIPEPPDERIMREIETAANIEEKHVNTFREQIVEQLNNNRMDFLFKELDFVFEWLAGTEKEKIQEWLRRHQDTLPGRKPYLRSAFDKYMVAQRTAAG